MNYCLLARRSMERRSVTSCYHGSNICGSQQPFLTETAICIVERWKKSGSYRFVPECYNARKSHTCHFFSFFPAIFAWPGFVEIQTFATMATWRNYFSCLFLTIIKLVACGLCWKYYTYLIVYGCLTNSCKFLRTLDNIEFIKLVFSKF